MYEVDFLPVEAEDGPGSKSGDAIAIHFKRATTGEDMVVVIDGGFSPVGDDLADHIEKYYGTKYVDLVISTHPDADHINGLAKLLERVSVEEILLHRPSRHHPDVSDFSNIESVENLIDIAKARKVKVTEPFTGLTRFEGQLTILGPTKSYYEELVAQHIAEVQGGAVAKEASFGQRFVKLAKSLLDRALSFYPAETLDSSGETGPRNNTSVITLLQIDNRRLLFTGDAGVPALNAAADFYEELIGSFSDYPLTFIQVPHHGSRRNVDPNLLDRLLGRIGYPHSSTPTTAFVSSAKADKKHPSPKVTNAFGRRGCNVAASEGRSIFHSFGASGRSGWSSLDLVPPLEEDDDD